jgi:putative oxidoreductase
MPRSSILLVGSIAFRLVGGFSVLLGFRARIGGFLLVAFIAPAAFLAHDFWAMPAARQAHETIEFLNNMAIAAGALLVALNGAGPLSIDSIRNNRRLAQTHLASTALTSELS